MLRLLAQILGLAVYFSLLHLPFAEGETAAVHRNAPDAGQAVGGPLPVKSVEMPVETESTPYRDELRVLRKKEDILRVHFEHLRAEAEDVSRERAAVERALAHTRSGRDRKQYAALNQRLMELESVEREIDEARKILVNFRRDRERYEQWILASLPKNASSSDAVHRTAPRNREDLAKDAEEAFALSWPTVPSEGLSAGFLDTAYEERFGIAHEAIDIPVEQGSAVLAAADGVVFAVHDRGYGYNTLVLGHEDGLQTLYGHVNQFLVAEGERVRSGQMIARSGGRPGSKGAGFLTTGPHVHFETRLYGQAIDPLYFLPALPEPVMADAR